MYPSSVNRGYFSYSSSARCTNLVRWGIHPLSIEAISPTTAEIAWRLVFRPVSILCQSRLFLLPPVTMTVNGEEFCIHPLSIEAISPTRSNGRYNAVLPGIHPLSIEAISPTICDLKFWSTRIRVSILCQSRLFLLLEGPNRRLDPSYRSIHPLSIEAISPTILVAGLVLVMFYVSILCQSRLFLLRGIRGH